MPGPLPPPSCSRATGSAGSCSSGFPTSPPRDEAEAYEIQSVLHALLVEAGREKWRATRSAARLLPCRPTSKIPRPAAGGVFDSTVQHVDGRFRHADFVRPGVECELAVRLSRDLVARDAPFEREEVEAAVGSVMAAIERRRRPLQRLGQPRRLTLIADDFFGAGCVLGSEREAWRASSTSPASRHA